MAHETWNDTRASWRAAFEALVGRFRPLYLAEVERFAEELRPRFAAGELHGYRDAIASVDDGALDRLEELCREHFGLQVDQQESCLVERDALTAQLILAVSPSADEAAVPGQEVPSFNASYAAAWDVLAVARARGWYTPAPNECPNVELTRWAEARS